MNKKEHKSIRVFLLPMIFIALLTALDQFTKYIVTSGFELHESKKIIDGVFSFTYIQNRGMAWGMFQNKIPIVVICTGLGIIFAFRILYNVVDNKRYRWAKYVLILLVAGAIGNFIDRVKLGYVVDFLHFELIDFPVFNVADVYIVISMISAILLLMFVYSNEELDDILKISFVKADNNIKSKESEELKANKADDSDNISKSEASENIEKSKSLDDE
ncbi:MAG: signal peptidase II [Lachnospiraceae bacterium]|nr:signal peptidase II [Lachnospiraceae bacterium]